MYNKSIKYLFILNPWQRWTTWLICCLASNPLVPMYRHDVRLTPCHRQFICSYINWAQIKPQNWRNPLAKAQLTRRNRLDNAIILWSGNYMSVCRDGVLECWVLFPSTTQHPDFSVLDIVNVLNENALEPKSCLNLVLLCQDRCQLTMHHRFHLTATRNIKEMTFSVLTVKFTWIVCHYLLW